MGQQEGVDITKALILLLLFISLLAGAITLLTLVQNRFDKYVSQQEEARETAAYKTLASFAMTSSSTSANQYIPVQTISDTIKAFETGDLYYIRVDYSALYTDGNPHAKYYALYNYNDSLQFPTLQPYWNSWLPVGSDITLVHNDQYISQAAAELDKYAHYYAHVTGYGENTDQAPYVEIALTTKKVGEEHD